MGINAVPHYYKWSTAFFRSERRMYPMKFLRLVDIIGNRKKEIPGIIPMSRSSWYDGIKKGLYPAPVKLSERSTAWRSTDIDALVSRLSEQGA
jgi:predicted DNA-binding transcriptional regulator AlpA